MLDKNINLRVPCVNIVSKNLSLQTVRTEKLALSVIDRKRHWFDDNTSVGYGHYSLINKKRKVENEIRSPRIQKSHPVNRVFPVNLTYRRGLPGSSHFPIDYPPSGLYSTYE